MKPSAYDLVTERVITMLESGTAPWRRPWNASHHASGGAANLLTGRPYHGVNALLLPACGYASPYWLTFKGARTLGGTVRRGEKAFPVVFWKFLRASASPDASEGAEGGKPGRLIPFLRYFSVFNLDQCDIPADRLPARARPDFAPEPAPVREPIAACEEIVAGFAPPRGCPIAESGDRAFYTPAWDEITLPPRDAFPSLSEFYSTAFHEMSHATGHASRLDRLTGGRFGSESYGREELVAEMSAAFLCNHAGILPATVDNSAAYLAGWLRTIKADPRAVVVAAGAAQKAADYILNRAPQGADESEGEE